MSQTQGEECPRDARMPGHRQIDLNASTIIHGRGTLEANRWALKLITDSAASRAAFRARLQTPRAAPYRWRPTGTLPRMRPRDRKSTSELQSLAYLVCRLLLEKKKKQHSMAHYFLK